MTHGDAACVTSKSLKPKDSDASDARDAKNPPDSGCPIPEQQIHRAVVQHLRARAQRAALKILLRRLRKRAEDKASWYII